MNTTSQNYPREQSPRLARVWSVLASCLAVVLFVPPGAPANPVTSSSVEFLVVARTSAADVRDSGATTGTGDQTTGIRVSIRALEEGPFLPGIPIHLAVTVRNTGTAEAVIPALTLSDRDNPLHSVDIRVGHGDDGTMERVRYVLPRFEPWKEGAVAPAPQAITLPAGGMEEIAVALSYNWDPEQIVPLVVAGQLRIQAALRPFIIDGAGDHRLDVEQPLESSVLTLSVERPEGVEARVWKRLNHSKRPWLLAHPSALEYVAQEKDFRRFQAAANMSSGIYSRHAAAVVAYMTANGNQLDPFPCRPPQPAVARKWLDRALAGVDEAPVPDEWIALSEQIVRVEDQP